MTTIPKTPEERARKLREKKRQFEKLRYELPHRYGYKWYAWAYAFYTSRNRMDLLCAANQISKSSTMIRRHIERATNKALWKELWPDRNGVPNPPRQFWYLYPSKDFATSEFQTKWVPEFMPKKGRTDLTHGAEKSDDPVFGWEAIYEKKQIKAIRWNSGVTTFFKTYTQDVHTLQGSSVHEVDCDEELPEDYYEELRARLRATEGYFAMVFTATLNQLMWLLAIEGKGQMEKFPSAFKQQISLYDCQYYMDGSPGRWHREEDIQAAIEECKSEAEVQRRVWGRFVADQGRKYPAFDANKHFIKPFPIPKNWHLYGGLDYGSGGKRGHPSAMGILAVNPNFREAYIIDGCRMDDVDTSSGDAVMKFIEMRGDRHLLCKYIDPRAKDCIMIAERMGDPFLLAETSHDIGEQVVNTLFASGMLKIFDTPELQKLGTELLTVMRDTPKRQARDDFIDGALRYPCTMIPWDWTAIKKDAKDEEIPRKKEWTEKDQIAWELQQRRGEFDKPKSGDNWAELDEEINFWNDMYE